MNVLVHYLKMDIFYLIQQLDFFLLAMKIVKLAQKIILNIIQIVIFV